MPLEGAGTDRMDDDYVSPDAIKQYLDACQEGEVENVIEILTNRIDSQIIEFLEETRELGGRERTGLGIAFNQHHYEVPAEVVKYISKSDHRNNIKIVKTVFPYVGALQNSDADVIEKLLNGISEEKLKDVLKSKTRWQWTSLMVACTMYDHKRVVETLLTKLEKYDLLETVLPLHENDNENSALHWACLKGHVNVGRLILNKCIEKNLTDIITKQNRYRMSALYLSCARNQPASRDMLLETASRNEDHFKQLLMLKDRYDLTVFHLCVRVGATESLEHLLEKIKDKPFKMDILMVKDIWGMTVLHSAVHEKQTRMSETLLEMLSQAELEKLTNIKDESKRTLLHLSCYSEDAFTFQKIMNYLNETALIQIMTSIDENGNNVLHACCARARADLIRAVLNKMNTACINNTDKFKNFVLAKNEDDHTALHIGCYQGQKDTVCAILDPCNERLRADLISMPDVDGKSALNRAFSRGEVDICSEILKYVQMMGNQTRIKTCIAKGNDQLDGFESRGRKDDVESLVHLSCQQTDNRMLIKLLDTVKNDEIAKEMLTECDRNGKTAFWKVFEAGDSSKVKIMLEKAKRSNCVKELVKCKNHLGQTLFHLAFQSQSCSKHCVEMVIDTASKETLATVLKEQDISKSKKYPFHFISNAQDDIIKLTASVDKNGEAFKCYLMHEKGVGKQSVFHKAAKYEDYLLLNTLSRYITHLKEKRNFPEDPTNLSDALCKIDEYGQSALHVACQQGENKVVKMLLKIGGMLGCLKNLFERKINGKTAFWKAFEAGDSIKVKIMLDAAQRNRCTKELLSCTNQQGQTLFHLAVQSQNCNEQCLEMVINAAKEETYLEKLFRIKDNSKQTFVYHIQDGGKNLHGLLIKEVTNIDLKSYGKGRPETDQTSKQTNGMRGHGNPGMLQAVGSVQTDGQTDDGEIETREKGDNDRWFLTHDLLTDRDIHGKSALEYVIKEQTQWYLAFFDPFYNYHVNHAPKHNPNTEFINIPHRNFHLFNSQYKILQNHREKLAIDSSLLRVMERANCTHLINHKYVKSYLRACWWQFASRLYVLTLALHIILLASLIAVVVTHKPELETNNDKTTKIVFLTSQSSTLAAKFILLIFTILCIFIQFCLIGARKWLPIDDTTDFIVYVACLIVSAYSIVFEYKSWVHELGLATMIASSVNFIWMLTKIAVFTRPRIAKIRFLCIMLFHVMSNVCIFLPIYILFILTFAGAFHIVFRLQEPFAELGYTIIVAVHRG